MSQINVHLTAEFEQALAELMRLRQIKTKSDAIRAAVQEALERERRRKENVIEIPEILHTQLRKFTERG